MRGGKYVLLLALRLLLGVHYLINEDSDNCSRFPKQQSFTSKLTR
jgi:hypothetical protein